jgi:hypothetical protein
LIKRKRANLAVRVATFLDGELARGADAALLSMSLLGIGIDLLALAQSPETASAALFKLARDIRGMDFDGTVRKAAH